jgi:hypothetical protein
LKIKFYIFLLIPILSVCSADAVGVASRGNARASVVRGSAKPQPVAATVTVEEPVETDISSDTATDTQTSQPEIITDDQAPGESDIENKSDDFAQLFGGVSGNKAETPLQRSIREQREKLGLEFKKLNATISGAKIADIGQNTTLQCDNDLRKCMASECGGENFVKCFNYSDTDWGMKMDSCRRKTKCNGEEFAALSVEIKTDRDQNAQLAGFSEVVSCGKTYNDCIRTACGGDDYNRCIARGNPVTKCRDFANSYGKCLSKSGGDTAIARCADSYKKCQTADSGLQARAMDVFAWLRVGQEKNILKWEKELYDIRDQMGGMCKAQNGMLDQRSLQCVYTVELFADNDGKDTRFATKKLQGESTYSCNPDWFGIDITTFKENAYRLTRSQTGATSAMMGAGMGVGVGALTSGAIGRAMDVKKAADAAKDSQQKPADAAPVPTEKPAAPVQEEKADVPPAAIVEEIPVAAIPEEPKVEELVPAPVVEEEKPLDETESIACVQKIKDQIKCDNGCATGKKISGLYFTKDGKRVDISQSDALKLSTNWNYDSVKLYQSNASPLNDYEKDACDTLGRVNNYINNYKTPEPKPEPKVVETPKPAPVVDKFTKYTKKYNNDTSGLMNVTQTLGYCDFSLGRVSAATYNEWNKNVSLFKRVANTRSKCIDSGCSDAGYGRPKFESTDCSKEIE